MLSAVVQRKAGSHVALAADLEVVDTQRLCRRDQWDLEVLVRLQVQVGSEVSEAGSVDEVASEETEAVDSVVGVVLGMVDVEASKVAKLLPMLLLDQVVAEEGMAVGLAVRVVATKTAPAKDLAVVVMIAILVEAVA